MVCDILVICWNAPYAQVSQIPQNNLKTMIHFLLAAHTATFSTVLESPDFSECAAGKFPLRLLVSEANQSTFTLFCHTNPHSLLNRK